MQGKVPCPIFVKLLGKVQLVVVLHIIIRLSVIEPQVSVRIRKLAFPIKPSIRLETFRIPPKKGESRYFLPAKDQGFDEGISIHIYPI